MIEVHTGNSFLDGHRVFSQGHSGDRIPFVLDKALPDHRWQLFADGKPVGRPRDMSEHLASDVREAVRKHQAAQTTEPAAEERTEVVPLLAESQGRQMVWTL